MTTKTDITLPPLPGGVHYGGIRANLMMDYARAAVQANSLSADDLADIDDALANLIQDKRDYCPYEDGTAEHVARLEALRQRLTHGGNCAAVEADRQCRMPSDESINGLWRECTRAWNKGKTETPLVQQFARALLSRYGSGQSAASAEPVGTVYWRGSPYPAPLVEWRGRPPEDGTPIYAATVAVQAQPVVPAAWKGIALDAIRRMRAGHVNCMDIIDTAERLLEAERGVAAQAQHPDDAAVDAFAAAMKAKLAQKRAEGRGGWGDKSQCSQDRLSLMLRDHVAKGDPVDVANFAMMLHQRGERISDRDATLPSAQDREDAERWRFTIRKVCAIGTAGNGYEFQIINLPRPLGNPMQGSVAQHFEEAIDAARAAKGADHA